MKFKRFFSGSLGWVRTICLLYNLHWKTHKGTAIATQDPVDLKVLSSLRWMFSAPWAAWGIVLLGFVFRKAVSSCRRHHFFHSRKPAVKPWNIGLSQKESIVSQKTTIFWAMLVLGSTSVLVRVEWWVMIDTTLDSSNTGFRSGLIWLDVQGIE